MTASITRYGRLFFREYAPALQRDKWWHTEIVGPHGRALMMAGHDRVLQRAYALEWLPEFPGSIVVLTNMHLDDATRRREEGLVRQWIMQGP